MIEFAGWTDSGMVRQAAFKGLRADKPAAEVEMENPAAPTTPVVEPQPKPSAPRARAAVMDVTITHPDKPLWPEAGDGKPVTKLDLAEYFAATAEDPAAYRRAALLDRPGARWHRRRELLSASRRPRHVAFA